MVLERVYTELETVRTRASAWRKSRLRNRRIFLQRVVVLERVFTELE